jgi:hypothetical protein
MAGQSSLLGGNGLLGTHARTSAMALAPTDKAAARKEIQPLFTPDASAEQRGEAAQLLKGLW